MTADPVTDDGARGPMPGASVLVTDGEQRSSLAAVRSLGRAGHIVDVCDSAGRRSLAGASRYVRSRYRLPSPLQDAVAFAQALGEVVQQRGIEVVLPMTEASMLALLEGRDRLGDGVLLLGPSLDSFRAVSDKVRLLAAAKEVGIKTPGQEIIGSSEAAATLETDGIRYPVVLKPFRSVVDVGGKRVKTGVRYADDDASLRDALQRFPRGAYPVMLQQRITGPGVGVFLLVWQGVLLAAFSHRRLREKPPSGGVSVYRESIPVDDRLVSLSKRLLDHFDWKGVAMVEYKLDRDTGDAYLMEVNGRFWGSLQLAIDAGVDFPALLLSAALGQSPSPVVEYRKGVRSRWWWGDVDHLLARMRHSNEALSLPNGAPGRGAALLEFLRLWRPGDRNEVLRLSDPKPFFVETYNWFRGR